MKSKTYKKNSSSLSPLRIIFCDFDDIKNPLLGAGQAKATLEVGRRLAAKGHSIKIISYAYPGYKDRFESGLQYVHIGFDTGNIRLNNILYILFLPFVISRQKADIIIECFTAPISTLFTPLFTKIPVVALTTSFEAERFAQLYRLPVDAIQNFGLKFYKYAMPYTKFLEEKITSINPRTVTKIIPEGVDSEFFALKRRRPKHILFLGRFDMGQKGIDLLLRAYATVSKKIRYPLVMAGYGPDETAIKQLVKELGLDNKVQFVGGAFGAKKDRLLAESLFVAFSSRHEGFSLFSLEALAAGSPLVAFNIPGLSWATKKAVLKARAFDVNHYSQLLLEATNKALNTQMSASARSFAKKYTWENVANQFESFFYQIQEIEEKKSYEN